jgi:hypothetical protein
VHRPSAAPRRIAAEPFTEIPAAEEGEEDMNYVDGFVAAVPTANRDRFANP